MDFEDFNFDHILGNFMEGSGDGSDIDNGDGVLSGSDSENRIVGALYDDEGGSVVCDLDRTVPDQDNCPENKYYGSPDEVEFQISENRRQFRTEEHDDEPEEYTEEDPAYNDGRERGYSDRDKSDRRDFRERGYDRNSRRRDDAGEHDESERRDPRERGYDRNGLRRDDAGDRGQMRNASGSEKRNRRAERAVQRESRVAERKAEQRRRVLEKKADQRLIKKQRFAAEREREEAREYEQQQRLAARAGDREGRRKSKIGAVVFALVLMLIVTVFCFAADSVYNSPTSMPNLYAGTIPVGSMTEVEISQQLSSGGWDTRVTTPLTVTLPAGVSFTVDPVTAGVVLPGEQILQKAMVYGRTGNMFTTMFNYVGCLFKPLDLNDASTSLNTQYIQQQIDTAQQQLTAAVGEEAYTIDYEKGELRALRGAGSLELEQVGLMSSIVSCLRSGSAVLDYRIVKQEPDMPDFQSIHDQIVAQVVDAKYSDDGKFNVIDETVGCDFSVEQAVQIWNSTANGDTAVIPLQVTFPNVTGEELRSRLFNDVLGEMTTYFPNSTDERVNNVALCASKVDGTILYNGEVFSYNATVGERTEAAGFKAAAAYSGGEVVEEIGGGACQVSSTIYCATLYACMETVERTCHQFEVAYMDQLGLDATVSWPEPDFKFRNNKIYPIRIDVECDTEARSLTARIMGTRENDYTVELKTDKYQYVNEQGNWVGWRTLTYRILYDSDGNIVQVPDQNGNMVDYEYTNQIIEATGKPGMDTYSFHS